MTLRWVRNRPVAPGQQLAGMCFPGDRSPPQLSWQWHVGASPAMNGDRGWGALPVTSPGRGTSPGLAPRRTMGSPPQLSSLQSPCKGLSPIRCWSSTASVFSRQRLVPLTHWCLHVGLHLDVPSWSLEGGGAPSSYVAPLASTPVVAQESRPTRWTQQKKSVEKNKKYALSQRHSWA